MTQTMPEYHRVPPAHLMLDPGQPRKHFDAAALKDLVASVTVSGVIQPIVVRSFIDGLHDDDADANAGEAKFRIISGERRWRAASEAKLEVVPILVRDDLSDADILGMQITENLQRQDLTLHELVVSVSRLVKMIDLIPATKKLGKDKSWVSRLNGVSRLWVAVQGLIRDGHLHSIDAAHDLSHLHDVDPQCAERLVKEFTEPPAWRATPPTRELIRSELERARKVAADKQSLEREREETKQQRREEGQGVREIELPQLTSKLAGSKKTPFQKGREELAEAKAAERKRAEVAVEPIGRRLMKALNLSLPKGADSWGTVIDADGVERVFNLLPPDPDDECTAEDLHAFDHKHGLWRLELDLAYDELPQLLDAIEGNGAGVTEPPLIATVRAFLRDCTVESTGERIKSEWLFERYAKWYKKQKRQDDAITGGNEFAMALQLCGLQKKRIGGVGSVWMNIKPVVG